MPDYQRRPRRFFYRGVSLFPQDALPDGKIAFAQNIRSYQEGTIQPRVGLTIQTSAPVGAPIHSIFRLNDTTPFGGGNPERRFLGAGTQLLGGSPGVSAYGVVDPVAYSGDPLNAVVAAPVDSPRPYLYVADRSRMRKINSDFQDSAIGIAPPLTPPTALYGVIQTSKMDDMGGGTPGAWTGYGASTGPSNIVQRIAVLGVVTITHILYDSGVTGMASVALSDMTGVVRGCTVDVDLNPNPIDKVIVQEVHPPVANTTIAAIQYDVGTNGLCTIQPTGSLSTGQIEAPIPEDVRKRYEELNQPLPPRVSVTRTVDFPVDSIVLLGAGEAVRILSVAYGDNNELSFRCSTVGTFAAGAAIVGVGSFRASFTLTKTAGTSVIGFARQVNIVASATVPVVGGLQGSPLAGVYPFGMVGTQATNPSDIIRFGFRADKFSLVESVRLLLNVDPTTVTFLQNYFMYEWRQSDLASAVQSAAGTGVGLMADAQASAVTQGQVDAQYGDQYGQGFQRGLPADAARAQREALERLQTRIQPITRGLGLRGPVDLALRGSVAIGSTQSRQLTLGDQQWVWLECRVGDLTRIGTDVTRTLNHINGIAMAVQIAATAGAPTVVVEIGDGYLTGGYGPDTGPTLAPYVYRYRWRRTSTGERGNPSPPMRGGVTPNRGLINLTGTQPAASDAVTDWFRFGGALARWAYVGTSPAGQNPPVLADDRADVKIDGGETLNDDLYQPWPTYDLPREGTGNVAGTSLTAVSGDVFDVDWAAGSVIIINGRATVLYKQPDSTSRLDVVDNIGSGTGVVWSMPAPTLLGQPLPAMWGGPINGTWFNFACGDPSDPGLLHWTHGNDPDATSERNTLVVTSASEPLQNGFFDDGVPYVFSSDKLYRIVPTFGDVSTFRAVETNCTKGLWSRWFFCVTPDGVYFGNKAGIYFTSGGAEAISITDEDLKPLFPQDGVNAESIRSLDPIDFTQPNRLKLSYVDSMVYFDYATVGGGLTNCVDLDGPPYFGSTAACTAAGGVNVGEGEGNRFCCFASVGADRTLVYEPAVKRWTPDRYDKAGVYSRLGEPGPGVHTHLIGCSDGNLYAFDETKLTDEGTDIAWATWTPWEHGDDPRADKQWGDAILDLHPGDSEFGVVVTPVVDNGNTALASSTVGVGGLVRVTVTIEVSGGVGVLSRNFGLLIQGATNICDGQRPLLYLWEPSFVPKQIRVARRATDWENLGYTGAKFIQGVVLRANTYGASKQVAVQFDGVNSAPQTALTLSVQHNGERSIAYPLAAAGWSPFIAELVRLQGADNLDWTLLDWRWVWEPAPELATQWETQDTTFDLPGYLTVRDAVIAYQSTDTVTVRVFHDASSLAYTLPNTGGVYQRLYLRFQAAKGLSAKFRLTSSSPFRLFQKDCSIRVQGWGLPGGYQVMRPFGGPHREAGAQI